MTGVQTCALPISEAISDYASISLVTARLFRAVAQDAEAAQQGEKRKNELLNRMRQDIQSSLTTALYPLDQALEEKMGSLTPSQKQALATTQTSLKRLISALSQTNDQPKS